MPPALADVAILGGGPAGMQAALVLARTRKRVIVFDRPEPPRNAASHGVHNFLGLDGLRPSEIRERAWTQIGVYGAGELRSESVGEVSRPEPGGPFAIDTDAGTITARHVVLACGFEDVVPSIEGFDECWGKTIFSCPFCDGYENRDRLWGIVPASADYLDFLPEMSQNWTSRRLVIAQPGIHVSADRQRAISALGVPVHRGRIVEIHHDDGNVGAIVLDGGEQVTVEALHWTLEERVLEVVRSAERSVGLGLDDEGHVIADEFGRTNVPRLWAAGDVRGWAGAIDAAAAGGAVAHMIVREWFAGG